MEKEECIEKGLLDYIRWCIDNGHYSDQQYDYLLAVGEMIIKSGVSQFGSYENE